MSQARKSSRIFRNIATPGGHLSILILLFMIGIGMEVYKLPKGEDVVMGVLGAILMAITGGRRPPPAPPPVCPYAQIARPLPEPS